MPKPPPPNPWQFATAGLELAGIVGMFCLIGYWIDGRWGTSPWAVVTAAAIGIIGGLYRLVRDAKRAQEGFERSWKKDNKKDSNQP